MKQDIENIIKKNLPMKYELSDENYDLKQIHISYNEAIDDIDTSLIADEVLKVVVEKITKDILDEIEQYIVSAKAIKINKQQADFVYWYDIKLAIKRLLSNLSPNKENEIIHKNCGTKSCKGEYKDGVVDYLCKKCDCTFLDNDEQTIIS